MYTESIETERALCADIIRSHDIHMRDGEKKEIRECPKCLKGKIITQCNISTEDGYECWNFKHYCDFCGEVYDASRIRSDIFFHTPFTDLSSLSTPLGEIKVKINGKEAHFRYRTAFYDSSQGKSISIGIIDIDVSHLKIDDTIFCRFDSVSFDDADSDENSIIHFGGNETLRLGFCAYDPDEYYYDDHCFILEDYSLNDGFCYKIKSDPCLLDEKQFHKSKIISLAIAWINKDDFTDPDTELFLALTLYIC